MKSALLLSGGMDSIAIAFWRRPTVAFTVDYGQKAARGEIRAARAVVEALQIEHHVIHADLTALGSGDMAGTTALSVAPVSDWWPFRNQMLVTLAAMKGVSLGVDRLLIGTLKTDLYHADGRTLFIEKMGALLRFQEGGLDLEAPAVEMTAAELIRVSNVPVEILGWAHSCHVAEYACGMCGGCRKHYETLKELGIDPY
jgi:7-cyano-7-deazaguanine synthase